MSDANAGVIHSYAEYVRRYHPKQANEMLAEGDVPPSGMSNNFIAGLQETFFRVSAERAARRAAE